MIIFQSDKKTFINYVINNQISDVINNEFKKMGIAGGSLKEINSWNNSMQFVKNLIDTNQIKDDVHIAIEYKIPFSNKRIDFMIMGSNDCSRNNIVIIELKQWQNASIIGDKQDIVETFVGNKFRDVLHPSYQAMQYFHLLTEFNGNIIKEKIKCFACAYLHNASKEKNIDLINIRLFSYVSNFPIYFKSDFTKLQSKIIELVKNGNGKKILYSIENGDIVPSKKLIDAIANIIKNKKEFVLIDSQKLIYENILSKFNDRDNVFIVNGNPGTGKSVVAVNLLSSLLNKKKTVLFVAPNAAYRNVIIESLKNKVTKDIVDNLFSGSSSLWDKKKNLYDWIIVDEAHRLKEKAYMYKGKNQIFDVLNTSKNTVFFVDENQIIRNNDIGTNENIRVISLNLNKKIFEGENYLLETQFRCSGMDGYINAIDTTLQIKETANFYLNETNYEFKICDTPQEMENLLKEKINKGYKNSKILAGYAWKWESKKMEIKKLSENKDIKIEEFNYEIAWNYNDSKMLWAIKDYGLTQAGCIHTCQGLEFDYCGVIIGNDLSIDDENNLFGDYENYFDIAGKKGLKNNTKELTKLIKNIYKVLLSRAQKGTFVFIRDKKLKNYFKKHINGIV